MNIKEVRREPITVTLRDGSKRELAFTLNSMAYLEEQFGSVEQAMEQVSANKISAIIKLFYAGFMDTVDGITLQQVGSLIDTRMLPSLIAEVEAALNADTGSEEKPEVK